MSRDEGPGPAPAAATAPERIARRIARAGVCSRRDAEKLIAEGRVAVNGARIASPALNVAPGDTVTVDGAPLAPPAPPRLWRYHKPRGLLTTSRDPKGRPTIFESLPATLPRVVTVGRLDFNTEGLLLLTNDGALARMLELPATGWTRRYRVRVFGPVDEAALASLKAGVTVEGVRYGPVEAVLERRVGANAWLSVAITEGKNREVRNVLGHVGLSVTRLIRIAFGPFQLGHLPAGEVAEVPPRALADQLGRERAARLGLVPPAGVRPKPSTKSRPGGKSRDAHRRRSP